MKVRIQENLLLPSSRFLTGLSLISLSLCSLPPWNQDLSNSLRNPLLPLRNRLLWLWVVAYSLKNIGIKSIGVCNCVIVVISGRRKDWARSRHQWRWEGENGEYWMGLRRDLQFSCVLLFLDSCPSFQPAVLLASTSDKTHTEVGDYQLIDYLRSSYLEERQNLHQNCDLSHMLCI